MVWPNSPVVGGRERVVEITVDRDTASELVFGNLRAGQFINDAELRQFALVVPLIVNGVACRR